MNRGQQSVFENVTTGRLDSIKGCHVEFWLILDLVSSLGRMLRGEVL